MRGDSHVVAGEPCLAPLRMMDNGRVEKNQHLLADARNGNLHQMKKHLRNSIFKKPEDINQRDERYCTPMHYAAKNSHIEMIK